MGPRVLIGLAAACAAIFAPAVAQADTLNATCATLQDQLNAANGGDEVVLAAAGGLCSGSYYLPDVTITLTGEDGAGFQPTDEESSRSLYNGESGVDETVRHLVFKGNAAGAGGFQFYGSGAPTIEDSTFSGISETYSGGALEIFCNGHVVLRGDTFTGNTAGISGGGARIGAASVTVEDSTFSGNEAGQDGGGLAITTDASGDAAPTAFRGRVAVGGADVTLTGNTFSGNVAGNPTPASNADGTGGGGGLWVGKNGDAIDGAQLASIPPYGTSGGSTVSVALTRNVFDANAIADGDDSRSGGGAEFMGAHVNSYRNRFTRNSVGTAGGGEYDSEGGGLAVYSPTSSRASTMSSVNDAYAGNSVGDYGDGAGIYIGTICSECNGTEFDLYHSTVAGNVGGPNGHDPAISATPGDTLGIHRSIVKTNTVTDAGAGPDDPEIGGYSTLDVTESDVCLLTLKAAVPDADGNICADPLLAGPAKAAGADVHQTIASPTVDMLASSPGEVDEDYEGDGRPYTVSDSERPFDMGADELIPADYGVTLGASPSSVTVGDTITYTATVTNAGPAAAKGLTATFSLGSGLEKHVVRAAGACTGSGPVACPVGDLAAGGSTTVALALKAATAGTKSVTVTVTGPAIDKTTGDHTATATATANAPAATPTPAPSSGVQPEDTSGTVCGSKRYFTITLRKIKGITFAKATITVNGKPVKVRKRHGRLSARVDLRKIGRKTIHVRIRATTTKGQVLKGTRTYHPCRPGSGNKTVPKL